MLLIVSRTVTQGRGAGFASLFGAQVGIYGHAAAVALGLAELFRAVPLAYDAVRYSGAAYLLVLAWSAFRSAGAGPAAPAAAPRLPLAAVFRQGVLTNLLNPKVALFALALFPQFVKPDAGPIALQIMLLATVLNAVGLVVNGSLVLGASRAPPRCRDAPSLPARPGHRARYGVHRAGAASRRRALRIERRSAAAMTGFGACHEASAGTSATRCLTAAASRPAAAPSGPSPYRAVLRGSPASCLRRTSPWRAPSSPDIRTAGRSPCR